MTDLSTLIPRIEQAGVDEQRELLEALRKIKMGRYDGLEVHHYSARECREIARAAICRAHVKEGEE